MPLSNTEASYGSVARALHWFTALLILTAIGLGLLAVGRPTGSDAEVAAAARLYSLHKTVGIAAFAAALARILWALLQPRPGALNPERRLEHFLAGAVHWALYGAMLVLPLSGWVHHAATSGFAPILWPFGQSLPFVHESEAVAEAASRLHYAASWLLYLAVALHVAGALKHALLDRDAVLARMVSGVAPAPPPQRRSAAPALSALLAWAVLIGAALALPGPGTAPAAPVPAAQAGNWQVAEGRIGFTVRQMAADVHGGFTGWTAGIAYDEARRSGTVTVRIPIAGMSLGTVTRQAAGPEFLNAAAHPEAVFDAAIAEAEGGLAATGTLTLRGATMPVTLPFTLRIEGDTARMAGRTVLDRRDFGIGPSYPDESTVGFAVAVEVELTATRR